MKMWLKEVLICTLNKLYRC